MVSPFFSIIIPTLNEEQYLPHLLSDLVSQKGHVSFEVIVVDSYSRDNTYNLALTYQKKLQLYVLQSKKRNASAQRNMGARKAKGIYLVIIDSDSRIHPSFLRKLKLVIDQYKSLVLLPAVVPQEDSPFDAALFAISNYFVEASQVIGKPLPAPGCMVFQKDFFRFIGGYDETITITDDHDLILRSRKAGVIARYLHQIQVRFSLRRIRKEGRITIARKYIITTVEMILRGRLQPGRVEYSMGGQYFNSDNVTKKISIDHYRKKFESLKQRFKKIITEE